MIRAKSHGRKDATVPTMNIQLNTKTSWTKTPRGLPYTTNTGCEDAPVPPYFVFAELRFATNMDRLTVALRNRAIL